MKDGKMTDLDVLVSVTIFRIGAIEVTKHTMDRAVKDISTAKSVIGDIPGLTKEQKEEQKSLCDDIISSLRSLSDFLVKQANRLEYENITCLEVSDPREGKE